MSTQPQQPPTEATADLLHGGQNVSAVLALEKRFLERAATWRERSMFMSSDTQMAMLPEYQQIIGMGPSVLPFLFRELQREPNHWFWALAAITGEDPVPDA